MIVIVANRWDESARALASAWMHCEARVLTPRDLSRAGWRVRPGRPERCTAVLEGVSVPQGEITGVLTRLPCVFEEELPHIAVEDRAYVAAESNAFLSFWLSSLTCAVINRPSAGCLPGPAWRPEQWAQLAARAGFAVEPIRLPLQGKEEFASSVTVVGGCCFGEADALMRGRACRLAAMAQVELLEVRFLGARFLGVQLLPDLSQHDVAAAVLDRLACVPATAR